MDRACGRIEVVLGWSRASLPFALAALLAVGCAGRSKPQTHPTEPSPEPPRASTQAAAISPPADGSEGDRGQQSERAGEDADEPPLKDLCKQEVERDAEPFLEASRRRLQETFCGATLWLDGLFGGEPDVENARAVSGRLELTSLYSEFEGFEPMVRLRVNYDLPTLENRLNIFLGRENEEEFVQDRRETFAVNSSLFGIETDDRWLAGLGYRPPGKWSQRLDFKVGGRLRSAPQIFAHGRWRRNFFVGEHSVWRLRETVFIDNREGYGSTTSIAIDHVPTENILMRWSNSGTVSEESDGLEWRSTGLLYWNLLTPTRSALGFEVFIRGATQHEVPLREYGVRVVHRRGLWRQWLYGEVIAGYSFPQDSLDQRREGSALVGASMELHFGRDPY